MKTIKEDKELDYEKIIIDTFNLLVSIYGVDIAIILIYRLNKNRGKKI